MECSRLENLYDWNKMIKQWAFVQILVYSCLRPPVQWLTTSESKLNCAVMFNGKPHFSITLLDVYRNAYLFLKTLGKDESSVFLLIMNNTM